MSLKENLKKEFDLREIDPEKQTDFILPAKLELLAQKIFSIKECYLNKLLDAEKIEKECFELEKNDEVTLSKLALSAKSYYEKMGHKIERPEMYDQTFLFNIITKGGGVYAVCITTYLNIKVSVK